MPLPMDALGKREEQVVRANLSEGEEVLAQAVGFSRQAVVVTSRKTMIVKTGFMAGSMFGAKVTSFDPKNATVEVRTSALAGVFEIAAGGVQRRPASTLSNGSNDAYKLPNCVPFGKSDLSRFQAVAAAIREQAAGDRPSPASADVAGQIRQLAALRDDGILSPEEFEAKKAELLSRM